MHLEAAIDRLTTVTGLLNKMVEREAEQGHTPLSHIVCALHGLAYAADFARDGMTDDVSFTAAVDNAIAHLERVKGTAKTV